MLATVYVLTMVTAFIELQPAPQSAFIQDRRLFTLDRSLAVVVSDHATGEDLAPLETLYEALGFTPSVVTALRFDVGRPAIYFGEANSNSAFNHRSLRRYAVDPTRVGPGGYHLYIGRNGIILSGADRAGTLHGMQTLIQLINASKTMGLNHRGAAAVPQVEIRDAPDMALRAVHVRTPLSRSQLQAYAALKCNMVLFESEDFYNLTPDRAALWRQIFDDARTLGITAVPLFEPYRVPESVLRRRPGAVEGRSRIERLVLSDDDWSALSRRNILLTPESPIRVQVDNTPMRFRQDYLLSEGGLEVPFIEEYAQPWMVRRMPGGGIPHGATAVITYSYAPPYSNALCPQAPETRQLLQEALQTLVRELRPVYIHGGFGDVTRLNQDLRCRDAGFDNGRAFAEMPRLMRGILADIQPETGMMAWADALLPPSRELQDDPTALHTAIEHIPGDVLFIPRMDANVAANMSGVQRIIDWMDSRGLPLNIAIAGDAPDVYRLTRILGTHRESRPGLIIQDADRNPEAARVGLARAWSLDSPHLIWPEVLNDYFETNLWQPDFEEVKSALFAYVENRILAGVAPEGIQAQMESARRHWPRDDETVRQVATLVELLTRYLELEYGFASGRERNALRELERLVRRLAELDPALDSERAARIVATIQEQRLFAPASILFGRPMAYYRPQTLTASTRIYELPMRVSYEDAAGKAEARLDLLVQCGPIVRLDFETVNARAITVEYSDDGVNYHMEEGRVMRVENSSRGPLLFTRPLYARHLRLRVESHGERAILREVRAFVAKPTPKTTCPMISASDSAALIWPDSTRAAGMLRADGARMAEAPAEIRLARNHTHLFIGVMAQDPTPHAMGAAMTRYDAPLWEEESVEIRIRPPGRSARRFLVNPLGAQHDGMAVAANLDQWDAGWDGAWRAQAERTDTGWTATLMLPFALFGGAPTSGDVWRVNFLRHRNNIERETSLWAIDPGDGIMPYGVMQFD